MGGILFNHKCLGHAFVFDASHFIGFCKQMQLPAERTESSGLKARIAEMGESIEVR